MSVVCKMESCADGHLRVRARSTATGWTRSKPMVDSPAPGSRSLAARLRRPIRGDTRCSLICDVESTVGGSRRCRCADLVTAPGAVRHGLRRHRADLLPRARPWAEAVAEPGRTALPLCSRAHATVRSYGTFRGRTAGPSCTPINHRARSPLAGCGNLPCGRISVAWGTTAG
jgi:hypothetical protein